MNKFINKILREAESSSDDFFKNKLSGERKKKYLQAKYKIEKYLIQIRNGLRIIKISYKNKDWDNDNEKLFLKLFSRFSIKSVYYDDNGPFEGIAMVRLNPERGTSMYCLYVYDDSMFLVDYWPIWNLFEERMNDDSNKIESFLKNMIKKYFNIDVSSVDNVSISD